jgi:peptidoglycan/LPS O-acetylase OafA/YrhL
MQANNSKSDYRTNSTSNGHLLFLDGIRGLAALFVTVHHMWLQLWPQLYHMQPSGWMLPLTGWLGYGHFGVTVFIVLSGFSLAYSAAQRNQITHINKKDFYLRRARRILPPYYFALLFSCLLATTIIARPTRTHWDVAVPLTIPGLLSHLFMMQDLFYISQINHTFWSVALEWKLYFLFPIILIACFKIGPFITSAVCTIIGYVALVLLHGTSYNNLPVHFIGLFAMGAAGALLVISHHNRWQQICQSRLATWIAAGSVVLIVFLSWAHYLRGLFYTDLFVALATVVGLTKMSAGRWSFVKAALAWKPLAFIGSFAYSLYLIHAPLIQCVWQFAVHPLGLSRNAEFFLLVLAGIPLILVWAYAFYLVCERPFIRAQGSRRTKTTLSYQPAVSRAEGEAA